MTTPLVGQVYRKDGFCREVTAVKVMGRDMERYITFRSPNATGTDFVQGGAFLRDWDEYTRGAELVHPKLGQAAIAEEMAMRAAKHGGGRR